MIPWNCKKIYKICAFKPLAYTSRFYIFLINSILFQKFLAKSRIVKGTLRAAASTASSPYPATYPFSLITFTRYLTSNGRGPIIAISPPDVKIETTFFQRNFFSTTPCNYPQKQHKKRTSDLSEVPILRCFLKILPPSVPLPASYQIPPDCILNGIYLSNDMSFLYPIRTFSISFATSAHC